jgi:hypothetical protein
VSATCSVSDPRARVFVYILYYPANTKIYDYGNASNPVKILPPTQAGSFALLLPNSPTISFTSGSWTSYLVGSKVTSVDVSALVKTPSSAALTSGTLNANLFFVGVPGLTAASAPGNANFQTVLSKVNTIYAQIGVQLGNLTYIDVTGQDAIAYTNLADADLGTMMKLSGHPQAIDGAINLFFVQSIVGGSLGGYIILGESAGIPGVPVRGSSGSGVGVTMADFPANLDEIAETIAHESGHWLGLFHTTESSGTSFDPLPDTPQCPAATYDLNHDNIVDATECAAVDGTNLMFWSSQSQAPVLTPNQKFVFMNHPLVNVAGTQVTNTPLGSVDVNTATISAAVIANVPAGGISLTLVGVVPARHQRYVKAAAAGANHGQPTHDD